MSNTSPLEPSPPDGAAPGAISPFILLEPCHETDISKQLDTLDDHASSQTSSADESKETPASNSDHDSTHAVPDHHLPPRPELQEIVHEIAQLPQVPTQSSPPFHAQHGPDDKRDSRVSFSSSSTVGAHDTHLQDTRQSIYLVDEDIQLHLRFHRKNIPMMTLWYTLCILTAGIWFIIDNWAHNKFWIRWNTSRTSLNDSQTHGNNKDKLIRIKSKHAEVDILPLKRVNFPRPMPFQHVFPASLGEPYRSPDDAAAHANQKATSHAAIQPANHQMLSHIDILEYRATTFLLHPVSGKFHLLASWRDPSWASVSSLASTGLPPNTVQNRQALFGDNQVSVKGKSVKDIMVEEVLHPFYIFQIYSIILWCNDDYVPYAVAIGIVSIVGIIITTITTKLAILKLKKMSRFSCDVSVLRSNSAICDASDKQILYDSASAHIEPKQVSAAPSVALRDNVTLNSEKLVPGDIIDLAAKYDDPNADKFGHWLIDKLPCDVVLLEGDCIVNEAMLTGESVPVVKAPISKADLANVLATGQDLANLDKNVLYSGTKLVRVRPASPDSRTRALVIRTGFSTAKGSLVRQMLFPRPISHKFYRDAFYFIGNLFIIATIGMIATIIYFHIIGVSSHEIALRSLDVLTIAVPPALPATLAVCITFSIARLKRGQIFCLSPQRINVAGMVNMFVFDKTGTLTEEGLDVLGIRKVRDGKFSELAQQQQDEDKLAELDLVEAMSTAHDLNLLDGEPIGEPLEVKMLEWTGRKLQDDASLAPVHINKQGEGDKVSRQPLNKDGMLARVPVILECGNNTSLAVVRTFEFTAALRRMSVVVKRNNEINARVYCKGAPESIHPLCETSSLPSDYNAVLDKCTRAGFRVLAVAGKSIEALGWQGAQTLAREQAESSLHFLGLIIFENKLKAATTPAIANIRQDAQLPVKMCTGDSVLTAVSVGKECGMLSSHAEVFTPRLRDSADLEKSASVIEWISVDDEQNKLDPYSLDPIPRDSADASVRRLKDIELAVSGEILRTLIDSCSAETMARILVHCKIFGRFSPEQKQELIERLQTLGYIVAFTGDGANDCGALKSADVGLSLSEAEASAAAPFTSRVKDISAIVHLIREGRSTLAVSFAMFKWMSCYSLTEYFTVVLLYGKATSLDNGEYLFIDLFCVLPIAIGLASTFPAKKLFKVGPEKRLSSAKPVVSMLGQVILGFLAQTTVYVVLHTKSWYQLPYFDPENLTLNDMDNTALFRVSVFSYVIAGFAFSLGPPHRQLLYFNWILFPSLVVLTVFCFYFLFMTGGGIFVQFGLVDMPKYFSWIIFGVVIAQFVLAMVFEFVALPYVAKFVARPFNALARRFFGKVEKPYKKVEKAIYSF